MISNALEILGIAMILFSAYLVEPALIIGLVGALITAIGYTRKGTK